MHGIGMKICIEPLRMYHFQSLKVPKFTSFCKQKMQKRFEIFYITYMEKILLSKYICVFCHSISTKLYSKKAKQKLSIDYFFMAYFRLVWHLIAFIDEFKRYFFCKLVQNCHTQPNMQTNFFYFFYMGMWKKCIFASE